MKILNQREGLLSNVEVFQILKEKKESDLTTSEKEVFEYLSKITKDNINREDLEKLKTNLKEYNLMDAEILQICNKMPKNSNELSLLVELLDDRYTEDQIEEILNTINKTNIK